MTFNLKERLAASFGPDYDPRKPASRKTVNDVETQVVQNKKSSEQDITLSANSSNQLPTSSPTPSNPPLPKPSAANPNSEPNLDAIHKILIKRFKTDESLTRIQSSPRHGASSEPLILIHDGSGISVKFQLIKSLDRELWAMANPKTFTRDTWDDLNAMANAYATKIATTITGPYIIGGKAITSCSSFNLPISFPPQKAPSN